MGRGSHMEDNDADHSDDRVSHAGRSTFSREALKYSKDLICPTGQRRGLGLQSAGWGGGLSKPLEQCREQMNLFTQFPGEQVLKCQITRLKCQAKKCLLRDLRRKDKKRRKGQCSWDTKTPAITLKAASK